MAKIIICIDRDGTLIYDERDHLFLGRDSDWRSKVKILPHVIEGIKLLNTLANSSIYMITNQPGVAIKDFPLLTIEKAHEVCKYVVELIKSMGGHVDGYFLCPHASHAYVKQHGKYHYDEELVCECNCIKPGLGMVFNVLESQDVTQEDVDIYVIGDRASDVETALNIRGTGILIPFENEPGEDEKVKKLKDQTNVCIARNLLDAAQFIVHRRFASRITLDR